MQKDKTSCICLFYIALFLSPLGALAKDVKEDNERQKRAIAVPLVYVGATVGPLVWAWLVAAFGLAAVTIAGISRTSSDSHSCANNRGWCRSSCFSHEYVDHYHSAVCGSYDCCRPR